MKFGKAIASLRNSMSIDQKTLAQALNITIPYLSQIENDKKKPSVILLSSFASFFKVPVSYLLYEALKASGASSNKTIKASFDHAEPVIRALVNYLTNSDKEGEKKNIEKEDIIKKNMAVKPSIIQGKQIGKTIPLRTGKPRRTIISGRD